ncbi:alpha-amylase family glycosyl hydrolase [Inconstantimicrobium mannanitabidum]|uniref:Cyclomaltodextrin glucanotransferase n=1 Tax=Inconstantimicrobium mannanitabidum TaxID=1604901 RepID=A0ACB5RFG6_9CLOT|nr:alpha-amylase family glycosyl hydrolase [Clostridium sp. TW13]GKX67827.1 putative cyclomaltodextrin glucanotransferase [Clostridium sp. TW13]
MNKNLKKTICLSTTLAVVMTLSSVINDRKFSASFNAPIVAKAATTSVNADALGPVTPKDVVYQILTDRFYNGDTSNDRPAGSTSDEFDGTDTDLNKYQGGDFQGIINKIPYLKTLGVTAVWVSPPYENREGAISGEYTAYHGFHASDYFSTNKHFGTMLDFARLRDALHSNGMKLVIDFATNHSSGPTGTAASDGKVYEPNKDANGNYVFDSTTGEAVGRNLVADPMNDSKMFFHHNGNRADNQTAFYEYQYKDLANLADYNQENPLTIKYLDNAYMFWKQKGIDGFRDDATLHQNPAFMSGVSDMLNSDSKGPITQFGEYFIGRPDAKYAHYASFPERTGINDLDFEFYQSVNTTFGDYSKTMKDFANMLVYTSSDYKNPEQAVTFIDNHDVSRFGRVQQNQRIFSEGLVALLTSRGIPNLYYGTEDQLQGKALGSDAGRVLMQAESNFSTTTTPFKVIQKLAQLRKDNNAIAYGNTTILYSDDNVLVEKRQFGNDVTIVAMNRSTTNSTTIGSSLATAMPDGTYSDYLGGLLGGKNISVSGGNIGSLTLNPSEVDVWQYNASDSTPRIGTVVSTRGRVGNQVYIYGENFDSSTTVTFNGVAAPVLSVSSDTLKVTVPSTTPGNATIKVTKGGVSSNTASYFILSGDQTQTIFHANATTNYGDNIYIVGNIPELGNWDVTKAMKLQDGMFCPSYPAFFLPVSVPKGTSFEFKFVKVDSTGKVYWEQGNNRTFTSTTDGEGVSDTPTYTINW